MSQHLINYLFKRYCLSEKKNYILKFFFNLLNYTTATHQLLVIKETATCRETTH